MRLILLFFISLNLSAGFSEAEDHNLYDYPRKKGRTIPKKRKKDSFSRLLNGDKEILKILKRSEKNIHLKRGGEKILALTRVKGILLNSILATNLKLSKFIVRIGEGHSELAGGELRCEGSNFEKRVLAKCNLLVLDEAEYKVDVELWDLDGAEGLITDYYYSGEEKNFLTSSFASFWQGILGKENESSEILKGILGVSKNASDKLRESGEKKITVSYINSGKKLIVFFNQSLKLETKGIQ